MINNTNQVIKHIFYLLEEMCFFIVFSMDYATLRSTVYPLPPRHVPANFPRLAVLNARALLICGASEHCLSPSPKARSR